MRPIVNPWPRPLKKALNLAQVAATYDAMTAAAAGDVSIHGINIRCTASGTTFTSVSIQTDDAVPRVLMTAAEGAVANIIAGSDPVAAYQLWLSPWVLGAGKKIQFTIIGATGTGTLELTALWRPLAGGTTLT